MHLIDIIISLFLAYFSYSGLKNGFIKELSSIIAYIVAFLFSNLFITNIITEYFYLDNFIKYEALRDKIAYLLSFIIIVYIFKIISHMIEKFINMKWQNKVLGLFLGIINGILIFALIISIFKEALPSKLNIHKDWNNKSFLYKKINILQQDYLVKYINSNDILD
jgi:membrane protein required for colicin V production